MIAQNKQFKIARPNIPIDEDKMFELIKMQQQCAYYLC